MIKATPYNRAVTGEGVIGVRTSTGVVSFVIKRATERRGIEGSKHLGAVRKHTPVQRGNIWERS